MSRYTSGGQTPEVQRSSIQWGNQPPPASEGCEHDNECHCKSCERYRKHQRQPLTVRGVLDYVEDDDSGKWHWAIGEVYLDRLIHDFGNQHLGQPITLQIGGECERQEVDFKARWKDAVEPLKGHDYRQLVAWVERLQQSDGEGWAVGETLRRILDRFNCGS